ncbi:hypothetical protein GCM10011609_29420 [Lentzea pudingi]|uniref:Uncharacterized protein n=1 Tax=Lentzea pudingi TaxID=1789439 RepID=A0ABQ2HUU7_9PSEU|nr:hypothetical protein [Lentzea pudingi]GGM90525.1 hypothetical protein GCM10011609_29420 [Lentzea pudingi]
MSELVFVTVPGARPDRLRVVVVPRLQDDLSTVGMADWPAAARGAALVVEIRSPGGEIQQVGHALVSTGRSQLWRAAFDGVAVRPATPPTPHDPPEVVETSRDADRVVTSFAESAAALSTPGPAADAAVATTIASWDDADPITPPPPVQGPPEWPDRPPLDFHGAVDHLREHPAVLRALGLVLELTVEGLPRSTRDDPFLIRVTWPAPTVAATISSPWTAYEFDGRLFVPHAAGDVRDGLLDLAGAPAFEPLGPRARWEVATCDVEGAANKLRDAARALLAGTGPAAMPALRSAGLMLLHPGRLEHFSRRTRSARANLDREGAQAPPFTAEDLMLGYRVDIKPQGVDDWLPLCLLAGDYTVAGQQVALDDKGEEGHLKANAATIEMAGPDRVLRTDEVVARWNGWSLVVPRPVLDRSADRSRPRRSHAMPFGFVWGLRVPDGTLPPLRFGSDYRMRVRIADLAGGGLGAGDGENDGASDLIGYARYEPVPPPRLREPTGLVDAAGHVDPAVLGPGGTIDRLVVRDGDAVYPANDERVLLAPATTFELAEQHGVLDHADEATWARAARAMNVTWDGVPAVETAEPVEPLPDPAAAGVTVFLAGADGQVADDAWGPWPTTAEKRLVLAPGAPGSRPALSFDDGVAVVTLPPAGEATVEVSSYVRRDDLSDFAIKTYLPAVGEDLAVKGRHPMATPARTFSLVHAVRRPLRDPAGELRVARALGATDVSLTPLLALDSASTAQLDVVARWDELVDDPSAESPSEEQRSVLVRSIVVHRGDDTLPLLRHDFGDTKHRAVTYEATATTRFRQYFAADEPANLFVAEATPRTDPVLSTARPDPPTVLGVTPVFRWQRDTPAGWSYQVGAVVTHSRLGGRLRVELARPWFSSGRGEALAVLTRVDADPPVAVQPYVSEVGRDPIYDSNTFFMSGDEIAAARWLDPESCVDLTGDRRPVPLAELGTDVMANPYAVQHKESRCFSDVAITSVRDRTYCPLARLAVARYQHASMTGMELSTVVVLDPVPLFPDRTLTIERTVGGLRVTLTGRGPMSGSGRTNRVDAILERCDADPNTVALTAIGPVLAVPAPGMDVGGVPSWLRVQTVSGGLDVPLPELTVPDEGAYRLYVREVERFYIGDVELVQEPHPGGELAERVVFADVVPLD